MIQILEDTLLSNGAHVGTMVKTHRGLMWNCRLTCGHSQLVLHSDLQAGLTPTCATCAQAVTNKANGIVTEVEFDDWKKRFRWKVKPAVPVQKVKEESNE